jgi:hypothetical protein
MLSRQNPSRSFRVGVITNNPPMFRLIILFLLCNFFMHVQGWWDGSSLACNPKFCLNDFRFFKLVVLIITSQFYQLCIDSMQELWTKLWIIIKWHFSKFSWDHVFKKKFSRKFLTYKMFPKFVIFDYINPSAAFYWEAPVHPARNKASFQWLFIRLM